MKRTCVLIASVVCALASSAQASFPGTSGRVAYAHENQIFTAESDGSDVRQLTSEGLRNVSPAWSADGASIAYACTDDLCVMGSDGSDTRTLTGPPYDEQEPAWSPNGRWLVYTRLIRPYPSVSYERHADAHIYKIRVDQSDAEPIQLTDFAAGDPEWSPDGKRIVFKMGGWSGYKGVWTMRPDGSRIRKVTDPYNQTNSPTWSPDGRWIAFGGKKRDRWRIALVRPDGTGLHEIGFLDYRARGLAWSPDGGRLLFTCGGAFDLCTVRRDGSDLQTIGVEGVSADWQPL